jgi:hypothetical protein
MSGEATTKERRGIDRSRAVNCRCRYGAGEGRGRGGLGGKASRHAIRAYSTTRDGSFTETIGRKPRSFRSNDELAALAMTTLALTRELRLVDLHGGEAVGALWPTSVVGVGPRTSACRRSRALHAHPDRPDGIEYRCRHISDEIAVALFDRVGDASLSSIGVVPLVADLVWLSAMRVRHQIWEPPS